MRVDTVANRQSNRVIVAVLSPSVREDFRGLGGIEIGSC